MSQFPLPRILDFIGRVTPFDTLERPELERVAARMKMAYFPRGQVVIKQDGPPAEYLYLIQKGSARVTVSGPDGERILIDERGEADAFGALSLLRGGQAMFEVAAAEDLIVLMLPGDDFRELVASNRVFHRHFSGSLARNIEAARRSADGGLPRMTGLEGLRLDAALVRGRVADFMNPELLTCLPMATIRSAARRMTQRQVGSIVVAEHGGVPIGILTDTDLRVKVVAGAMSFDQPVAAAMTHPVHTIGPGAHAFEALLEMSRHGVHYLVVTEGDRAVGIISDHDLQTMTGSSPVGVVRDIEKVASVDELVDLHRRVDRVLEMLLRLGGSAADMTELVTEFNDRLTLRLLELTADEMYHQGAGSPPVPYCWIALGSEGRREQTLRTDQDNALMYANVPAAREEAVKGWFLDYAQRVVEGLVRCGFPRCTGGVMASNPQWCMSEAAWQDTFRRWVEDPNPRTLRLASIFFDFRDIYAEADFLDHLREGLQASLEGNRLFLRYLAKNGLYNRPPLGFLRQFVVEKTGEHKNQLNLKLSGLTPVVDAARVMNLDLGGWSTNTLHRLDEARRQGIIKEDLARDLHEAFSFITILRITHHLEERAAGRQPDNFVNPEELNSLQRKMLKESFAVISRLQELMEVRYQTRLVT